MRLPSPIPYSKQWRNVFLLNTEANQYLVWHSLVKIFFLLELVQQLPCCTLSRIGKHGENVPVEKRQGLFMHWVHTVCTITYITTDSRSCRKSESPFVLSNTVVQKKTQSFCWLFLFSFHWLKELCNILSNVQYFNIFYLVKLYFFVIHSVSPNCLKSLWQKLPCSPALAPSWPDIDLFKIATLFTSIPHKISFCDTIIIKFNAWKRKNWPQVSFTL